MTLEERESLYDQGFKTGIDLYRSDINELEILKKDYVNLQKAYLKVCHSAQELIDEINSYKRFLK